MIPILTSIHEAEKVFDTGAKPILITCNDVQDWVCKHNQPSKLCNEIIGSKFAEIWKIRTPMISLINVLEEHLPKAYLNVVPPINFRKTCFGSLYLKNCKELDSSTTLLFKTPSFKKKFKSKDDFLKIALFDIWLCNEDRNLNNSNLLIDFSTADDYNFYVFDHGEIFNSNSLNRGIYSITEDESIIKTELAKILFKRGKNLNNTVNNLVENFYLCTMECSANLNNILALIPEDWGVNIQELENNIRENLFKVEWLEECENTFRSFIQVNLTNK